MTVVNTNVKALIAQQALTVNDRSLTKAMAQLSTGKRINGAADDAAGLAISDKMSAQIRGLNQAVRNANDAISMMQTADAAAGGVADLLFRMRDLAVQARNDTNSTTDKASLATEYDSLQTEVTRLSNKTTWNGIEFVGSAAGSFSFQIGSDSGVTMSITFKDLDGAAGLATAVLAATSVTASNTISHLDTAISTLDDFRGTLGAGMNRLTYATDNLTNIATNTSASRSRIMDADYAQATSALARSQIIQQAGTAMLAQANQQPVYVLALLR